MRSVNTSLIAMLPVTGLLFVGAFLLGAGTLKDLSLALFVGMFAGAYSSIFLCTPIFVDLKEREPQYKALTQRVLARRAGGRIGSDRSARRPEVSLSKEEPVGAAPAGPTPAVAAPTATRRPAGGSASKRKGKPGRPGSKRR